MASLKELKSRQSGSEPNAAVPFFDVDWQRVFDGNPFQVKDLGPEEIALIRRPVPHPVKAVRGVNWAFPPSTPASNWQRVACSDGVDWWMHVEAIRRSRMREFQRRVR